MSYIPFFLQIDGEFSYMIDIGVPVPEGLQIRISKGVEALASKDIPELLNCDLPFSFWVSWSGNKLQVGFKEKTGRAEKKILKMTNFEE